MDGTDATGLRRRVLLHAPLASHRDLDSNAELLEAHGAGTAYHALPHGATNARLRLRHQGLAQGREDFPFCRGIASCDSFDLFAVFDPLFGVFDPYWT